jgi:hypothetical protein
MTLCANTKIVLIVYGENARLTLCTDFGERTGALGVCGDYRLLRPNKFVRAAFVSGLPAFITAGSDGQLRTTAFEDGEVAAGYVMRNPDKPKHPH